MGFLAKIDARAEERRVELIKNERALHNIYSQSQYFGPWYGPVLEAFTGAWQQNVVQAPTSTLLQNSAVFRCVTGISSDIAKMRVMLVREDDEGIWEEVSSGSPWLPVIREPNHYQIQLKFVEQWIVSKLLHGNTYVLKLRDNRGIVNAMYVLSPRCVRPLVADNGDVYYELDRDDLSQTKEVDYAQLEDHVVVPASEIIHDRMVGLFHQLIGISPLYACSAAASLGSSITANSANFYANQSMPGGILTVPGNISDDTAAYLKGQFEKLYGGANRGRVAILSDGMVFNAIRETAQASQTAEQMKFVVEDVARAFGFPLHKLNGTAPPYAGSVEASNVSYYMDCLQPLIESFENHLRNGLSLPSGMKIQMDLDALIRMDTAAMDESNSKAVGSGVMTPNEARRRKNLRKVKGGDTPYLQEQNFSLEALAKRDAQEDPFANAKLKKAPTSTPEPTKEPPVQEPTRSVDSIKLRAMHALTESWSRA